MTESFFGEQEQPSRVKSDIVVAYFAAWARIVSRRSAHVAYWDPYSGPGRYESGDPSTPLLLLQEALRQPNLDRQLIALFSDESEAYVAQLDIEVRSLSGVERFHRSPRVERRSVEESFAEHRSTIEAIPTLTFLDPWGYRGLSSALINSVTEGFACDAVFFFNYNRINAAIVNELVEPRMQHVFTADRLAQLQAELQSVPVSERERMVMRALGDAVRSGEDRYLVPFRFAFAGGRTSHYICFVTKNPMALGIMKDIMAKRGLTDEDGVPRFEFIPSYAGRQMGFDEERPLRRLPGALIAAFSHQTLTVQDLFLRHHPGTPFVKQNYKTVLKQMEEAGEIACDRPRERRPKETLADRVRVTFA
ncbi:MAG TPA: three-Cys-motif partner protein TcmP [Dehalococcoidia bacterium]|nr:three-Cys-motif partner protein TcmP [Dehalococcoidia bacterium]